MGDETMIDSIFNYCIRRCERCQFSHRWRLYLGTRERGQDHSDSTLSAHVRDSLEQACRLMEAWCTREGIDFAQMCREAETDDARVETERADEAVRSDPLQQLATAYSHAALDVTSRLSAAGRFHDWSPETWAALDAIKWHANLLGPKVARALRGQADCDWPDDDPIQNDWNGSAKVARIIVDESKRAWQLIVSVGRAPEQSPVRELPGLLDRVDAALTERFPHAMEFVRPGFDDTPDA